MEQVKDKDPNGLCCLLQELVPDVDSEVFENIKRHKITGDIFLQLDEEYLREIAPLLGDRIRLKKIISSSLEPVSLASTPQSLPFVSSPSPSIVSESSQNTASIPLSPSLSVNDMFEVTAISPTVSLKSQVFYRLNLMPIVIQFTA